MLHVCLLAAALSAQTAQTAQIAQTALSERRVAHDIFKQLIEINTTESVGNTTVAALAMQKRLLDGGFAPQDALVLGPDPRKQNLVVRLRAKSGAALRPVLFIGHLDVVEARREDWSTDPFQFVEQDGYYYGRGTQDMKSSDAMLITDFLRLRREGYLPDRDIILALTAAEEGGDNNGVEWLLRTHRDLIDAEYVVNPDDGRIDTDHGRPVVLELAATQKLYADFQLLATNAGGHSSLPTPDNAIYHIADALARLQRYAFPVELNAVTREYFRQMAAFAGGPAAADMRAILETPPDAAAARRLSADPQYNSTLRTTCVATLLAGGHAVNALPQRAEANVNCRILPGHSAEEIRLQLVRLFDDAALAVRYRNDDGSLSEHGPAATAMSPPPLRADVMESLRRIGADLWPGAPVIADMEDGASDSLCTMMAGIPSYGFSGVAVDHDDRRDHGRDERIGIGSYYDGVEFFYRFLKALTSPRAGHAPP